MKIAFENENRVEILLPTKLDMTNYREFEVTVQELLTEKKEKMPIFDASELSYISSAGLRNLLSLQKKRGDRLKIINVSPVVFETFEITGFTKIMDVQRPLRVISVEKRPMIGKGANGEVYPLDNDKVVKVYRPETPAEDVERERRLAQQSFLLGIPTAISYDVVKTDTGRLGIVFELVKAVGLSTLIKNHPEQFDELADQYVKIFKQFHSMTVDPQKFPSAKEIYRGYINGCRDWYTTEELTALRCLIDSIPDRNTLIHGDYHAHNVLYSEGELIMIDMGDVSCGHPIFDFLATAATQANLVDLNPKFAEIHTGMPVEYIKRLWNTLLHQYFNDKSEEEIREIDRLVRFYSKLKVAFAPVVGRGLPEELIRSSVEDAKQNLIPYIDEMAGKITW